MPGESVGGAALHEGIGIFQCANCQFVLLGNPTGPLGQDPHRMNADDRFLIARGGGDEGIIKRIQAMQKPEGMNFLIGVDRLVDGDLQCR